MDNTEFKPSDFETPAVYPELKDRIRKPSFLFKANVMALFGRSDVVKPIMSELNQVATKGIVTTEMYLDEKLGGPGKYDIKMSKEVATQFVDAAEKFFSNPLGGNAFADSMGTELEALLTGNGPQDSYIKRGEMSSELPK